MPARWLIPAPDAEREQELARSLGIRLLAARVLVARGYNDPEAARRFLRPALEELSDPYLLTGMRAAVDRLRAAIEGREGILIYGDYDVDGTAAVVILKKAIDIAGGVSSFHVPHRLREGYGMQAEVVEQAARDGVRLIVSVDTGIRAHDVVRAAASLGIDVIITDHHLPEQTLPPALAVLNPNRRDCGYPDKRLCGAGVAFQLVRALLGSLGWPEGRVRGLTESFLKMAAIATVADVVPLLGENRILVKHGLRGLGRVRNPGLRALLDVAGFGPGEKPTANEIAFRIAPRINAAGRMASANDVIELFLSSDETRVREIAAQLDTLNQERQQTEAAIVDAILAEFARDPGIAQGSALIFSDAAWHRGVVGIVASRLVERFSRPVFVLGEEDGVAHGSGRGIAGFHLLEALDSMRDLFTRYGGHRQAAGVTLDPARVPEFRERLRAYAEARLSPEDLVPRIEVDAAVALDDLEEQAVEEVLAMEPFGAGNPVPLFALRDVEVVCAPSILKEKHLRVTLRQKGRHVTAVAWNLSARVSELQPGGRIDAVVALQDDPYSRARGWGGWSATLRDFRARQ